MQGATKAGAEVHLEPVLAYDRIAPDFVNFAKRHQPYLRRVEQLILSQLPRRRNSLLDIGSGDGTRAIRIAQAAGIHNLVLLDPSVEMRKGWPPGTRGLAIRAEELSQSGCLNKIDDHFDVITCLWNVLGHIFPDRQRVEVLRSCARLLAPEGLLFIDLNHRYNARHYGVLPTGLRMLRDLFSPRIENGDVTVHWHIHGTSYVTDGHVFRDAEFRAMARSAALEIINVFTIDYLTGEVRRSKFAGNPLYILRRA